VNGKQVVEKGLESQHESLPVDLAVDADASENKHASLIDGHRLKGRHLHLEPTGWQLGRYRFRHRPLAGAGTG
jgi:hypothetical protein